MLHFFYSRFYSFGDFHACFIKWGMCRNRKGNFQKHLFTFWISWNKLITAKYFQLSNKFNISKFKNIFLPAYCYSTFRYPKSLSRKGRTVLAVGKCIPMIKEIKMNLNFKVFRKFNTGCKRYEKRIGGKPWKIIKFGASCQS